MRRLHKIEAIVVVIILMLLMLVGCSDNSEYYQEPPIGGTDTPKYANSIDIETDRKIIYTVDIGIYVDNTEDMLTKVKSAIGKDNGWCAEEVIRDDYVNVVVRIKTTMLDDFVEDIGKEGEVVNYTKRSSDVSDQYYDTERRIDSLEAESASLNNLLSTATEMADIMLIVQRLTEIDTELNVLGGDIAKYDSLIEYSTVNISVYRNNSGTTPFGIRLSNTFGNAWSAFVSFLEFLVMALVSIVPFLILLVPVAVVVVVIVMRERKKKASLDNKQHNIDNVL